VTPPTTSVQPAAPGGPNDLSRILIMLSLILAMVGAAFLWVGQKQGRRSGR
jgi:hypothetical protein